MLKYKRMAAARSSLVSKEVHVGDWQASILDTAQHLETVLVTVKTLRLTTNFIEPGAPGRPQKILHTRESVLEFAKGAFLERVKSLPEQMPLTAGTPGELHEMTITLVVAYGKRIWDALTNSIHAARRDA